MKNRKRLSRLKGYAAIEFTLALPFLLMMLCAVIDFGRMYMQYTTLTKAVRTGARWAVAVENPSDSDIQNVVVYGRQNPSGDDKPVLTSLSAGDVVVDYHSTLPYVTVSVDNYNYTPLFFNIYYLKDSLNLTFSASSVMRVWP